GVVRRLDGLAHVPDVRVDVEGDRVDRRPVEGHNRDASVVVLNPEELQLLARHLGPSLRLSRGRFVDPWTPLVPRRDAVSPRPAGDSARPGGARTRGGARAGR